MRVAAIIVTYVRPDQLRECLAAVGAQSRHVDHVYLVDNEAVDAADAAARRPQEWDGPPLTYLAPGKNLGGAGGFCMGIERAYADGFDWFWLLDDDAVPAVGALEALLAVARLLPAFEKPALLSSLITGTDGRPHSRNVVTYKRDSDRERAAALAALGCKRLRTCTFVSVLIARRAVSLYGYPIADYFIWGDDAEYTARILRREPGFQVDGSVVCHNTKLEAGQPSPPGRLFLVARNYTWMLLYSRSFSIAEKLVLTGRYALEFVSFLFRERRRPSAWLRVAQGLAVAVTRRPTPARPPNG